MELPDGVRIQLEFDEARIGRPPRAPEESEALAIDSLPTGERLERTVRIGGRPYRISVETGPWSGESLNPPAGWQAVLPLASVRFPLLIRGWKPGDRVRTSGGTKTLKKLFLERRVARSARHQLPVIADADGTVRWVGGVERAASEQPRPGDDALFLAIVND